MENGGSLIYSSKVYKMASTKHCTRKSDTMIKKHAIHWQRNNVKIKLKNAFLGILNYNHFNC